MSSLDPDHNIPSRRAFMLGRYGRAALVLFLSVVIAWFRPTDIEAIDVIQFSLEDFEGVGLTMDSLRVSLEWTSESAASITLQLDQPRFTNPDLEVPDWMRSLRRVRLDCPKARLDRERFQCRQGKASLPLPWLDKPDFLVSVDYGFDRGSLKLDFQGLALAGGRGSVSLSADTQKPAQPWVADYRLSKVVVTELPELAAHFVKLKMPLELTDGTLDAAGRIRGRQLLGAAQVRSVGYDLKVHSLSGGNEEGTLALDGISMQTEGELFPRGQDLRFDVRVEVDSGEFYAEPFYLDFSQVMAHFIAGGRVDRHGVLLEGFEFSDPGSLKVEGRLALQPDGQLSDLNLSGLSINLDKAYPHYLQSLLAETNLEDLEIGGLVTGELSMNGGVFQHLDFQLQGLNLADLNQRFGLYEVEGRLRWHASEPSQSMLKAKGGYLLAMDLGPFEWQGISTGKQFQLRTPARLPLLDGSLLINDFQFSGGEEPAAVFEAVMTPISMKRLAHAFSWPAMEGRLSGVIPRITFKDGRLDMDGTLLVRAFDGQLTLTNLAIDDPLGITPRMDVDVSLKDLDLETLTRTFAFGRIEGRLEGEVEDLTLVNWEPVSFDARFATPEEDDSRHRISQRAVDNLTSLGGGIGGALSQTFLRFFEEFSYERLGLSCRLRGSVCAMDGVEQAEHGYYIVKGSGLPQINVIGYSRRVDWPTMVGRLKRLTQQGGPVIQ